LLDLAEVEAFGGVAYVVAAIRFDGQANLVELWLAELNENGDSAMLEKSARIHLGDDGSFLTRSDYGLQRSRRGTTAGDANIRDYHGLTGIVNESERMGLKLAVRHRAEIAIVLLEEAVTPRGMSLTGCREE